MGCQEALPRPEGKAKMANILIVDGDEKMNGELARKIGKLGHYVRWISALEGARDVVVDESCDLVFLRANMPDGSGLEALPDILRTPSQPEVIVLSETGDAEGAKRAIESGAWDYVEKSASTDRILQSLADALRYREGKVSQKPRLDFDRERIVGTSDSMRICLDLLAQASATDANVLIAGETGTGKELFARAIHINSRRSGKNLVVVDCTALPETLLESMLFGHERGAFTGADRQQEGLFKQADGGTLFLDEVGELPLSHQKAFLRILQERRFRPIGSQREVASDFRLLAATNRNLDKMVQAGEFRKDLLFRLRSFLIIVPPLKERNKDIEDLVRYHTPRLAKQYGMEKKEFSRDFFEALTLYDWPGNVRELVGVLERALTAARHEPTLYPRHLPTDIRIQIAQASFARNTAAVRSEQPASLAAAPPAPVPDESATAKTTAPEVPLETAEKPALSDLPGAVKEPGDYPKLKGWIEAREREYLTKLLALTGGNVMKASQISGLSRARLYVHLKKHDIPTSQKA